MPPLFLAFARRLRTRSLHSLNLKERESTDNRPNRPHPPPPPPNTLTFYPQFPFHGIETFHIYRQNLPAFCICFVQKHTHPRD